MERKSEKRRKRGTLSFVKLAELSALIFAVVAGLFSVFVSRRWSRPPNPEIQSKRDRAKKALDLAREAIAAETDTQALESEGDALDDASAANEAAQTTTSTLLSRRGSGWRGGKAPRRSDD